jgi:serine/threonine protein kinase
VEATIGRGGMGVVYRATDLTLERPVALKLIAPEPAEDDRFRAHFLREPRLAATLDHPNVTQSVGSGGESTRRAIRPGLS